MRLSSSRRVARLALSALLCGAVPQANAGPFDWSAGRVVEADRFASLQYEAPSYPRGAFKEGPTPLEAGFYNLPGGLDTAYTLPKRSIYLFAGQRQANEFAGGTGNQTYETHLSFAVSDRMQLGATFNRFADPVVLGGAPGELINETATVDAKFAIANFGTLRMAGRATLGYHSFLSEFYGTFATPADGGHLIGSVKLPVTLRFTHGRTEFHFVPGVTFLPDTLNGMPFYGTIYHVAAGATVRAGRRLAFYGAVNMPFGSGGNTLSSATGMPYNTLIWTGGARYMVTPKAALDVYVTNGMGSTPANDILAYVPDAAMQVGVRLTYTPGWSTPYRPAYYPVGKPTVRQRHLQYHGLTIASADTLEAGTIRLAAAAGTQGHYNASIVFSPDHNLEFGFIVEHLADDGSRPAFLTLGLIDEVRWAVHAKLRFLDQNNGDPLSLSGNFEFGREVGTFFGVAYLSAPLMYKVNERLALMAEPKVAGWSTRRIYGVAVGANYEVWNGIEAIGEVASVYGDTSNLVWAAGARVHLDSMNWWSLGPASLDVMATNAIGNHAAGTMIAQDEIRFSAGVSFAVDAKKVFDSIF